MATAGPTVGPDRAPAIAQSNAADISHRNILVLAPGVPESGGGTLPPALLYSLIASKNFSIPTGVAVDAAGNVYVADSGNNRIVKFDNNGTYMNKWGSEGEREGEFRRINGIAINLFNNEVYVSERSNDRIQVFNSDGGFVKKIVLPPTSKAETFEPTGLSIAWKTGELYVIDMADSHTIPILEESSDSGEGIYRFEETPASIRKISITDGIVTQDSNRRISFEKISPVAIAATPSGKLFIADEEREGDYIETISKLRLIAVR